MKEKSIFEKEEKEKLGQTLIYCGLVFRSSIKDFEQVRDYLLKWTDAELIFQTKSFDYLWISRKAPPKETSQ